MRNDAVLDSENHAKSFGIITIYPVLLFYKNNRWHQIDVTFENHQEVLAKHYIYSLLNS